MDKTFEFQSDGCLFRFDFSNLRHILAGVSSSKANKAKRLRSSPPAKARDRGRSHESTMLIIWSALTRSAKNKAKAKPSSTVDGHHWRPSVNSLLASNAVSVGSTTQPRPRYHDGLDIQACQGLLGLPKEIQLQIEEYLPPVDAVCLQQTCHKLRSGAKDLVQARGLTAVQKHWLRTRLDRDSFFVIWDLKKKAALRGTNLILCAFCVTLHDIKKFTPTQLLTMAHERICIAASRKMFVTGKYWTEPIILRWALRTIIGTGQDRHKMHWIPVKFAKDAPSMPLAAAIEEDDEVDQRRSMLFVDSTGLVLKHHFHIPIYTMRVEVEYVNVSDRSIAIGRRYSQSRVIGKRTKMRICPHLTIGGAALKLDPVMTPPEMRSDSCKHKGCNTKFDWCGCGRQTGSCFMVERRFGWLESF